MVLFVIIGVAMTILGIWATLGSSQMSDNRRSENQDAGIDGLVVGPAGLVPFSIGVLLLIVGIFDPYGWS